MGYSRCDSFTGVWVIAKKQVMSQFELFCVCLLVDFSMG